MRSPQKADLKSERVATFATCELVLDILYTASSILKQDLESIWIIHCVTHNTLRNAVTDPETAASYLAAPELPDAARLSMSRRAVADKTGLSRETVRRRTNRLIEDGFLEQESNGNVTLARNRNNPEAVNGLNQIHEAVIAYLKRIEEHDLTMPLVRKP